MIVDNMILGRWKEAREPNQKELDATLVVGIEITDASAKIRDQGANDELADIVLDVWAGVLEIETNPGKVVKNVDAKPELETPESVKGFRFVNHGVQG